MRQLEIIGISGSFLFNTGRKSTKRTISEIQGKINKIQSLDSQPSFADMLDKITRVQFNINAHQRLAKAGAKVKHSPYKRQRSHAFLKHMTKDEGSYKYPSNFQDLREEQKQAQHRLQQLLHQVCRQKSPIFLHLTSFAQGKRPALRCLIISPFLL